MPAGLHRTYGAHHLHFITCSCYRRLPFLRTAGSRDRLLSILEQTRRRYRSVVVGYVVMPEHIHLLITEPEVGTPSTVMQVLKQRTARALLPNRRRVDARQCRLFPGRVNAGTDGTFPNSLNLGDDGLGVVAQKVEICTAVGVSGQNDLPGIAALSNVVGNIHRHDASKASHDKKVSGSTGAKVWGKSIFQPGRFPKLEKELGNVPSGSCEEIVICRKAVCMRFTRWLRADGDARRAGLNGCRY